MLFFFFPSFLLLKKFSLFFLLSLFSQKKLQKRKKKVRVKSRRRRRKRRRREILVAFTRRKFLFTRSHSFFVVALLCGLLLSSRSYFCCIFSRDTSLEEGLLREEKGGLRFFLLGLWVRVKNVVGVLVADANAWMQILNFKCVRRVRLPAKEGLNCSSSRLAVMMLARDFFSSRACDKDLSLTTLLLFSLLFHSYTKQQAERKQTHTYT